jgi:phage tail sheath protein FI
VPEYLAPGVYVEETSFRSRSIEGVSTSTTAFAGPTANGPVGGSPELLTSFADFERIYGGVDSLTFTGKQAPSLNYVAHGARAYFNNGGARLYVVRVFGGDAAAITAARAKSAAVSAEGAGENAKAAIFAARFPGSAMNGAEVSVRATVMPVSGKGFLAKQPEGTTLRVRTGAGADEKFVLWFKRNGKFQRLNAAGDAVEDVAATDQTDAVKAEVAEMIVSVNAPDGRQLAQYEGLSPNPAHPRFIGSILSLQPGNRSDALTQPVALQFDEGYAPNPAKLFTDLAGALPAPSAQGEPPGKSVRLSVDGNDGAEPAGANYETANQVAAGFDLLIGLEDVSIVAAPGYSSYAEAATIQDKLIGHVEKPRRYRIAVLDAPANKTPSEMRIERGKIDSTRAALYYPWVVTANPLAGPNNSLPREIMAPPSGYVCGIYARTDIERGVWKAPANEVVRGALRFEPDVNFGQQELLNPLGVNCLRYLSGRGFRVWGARTASSDPEWKYVNVRRYFNYLEASIDRGTQWAVFEPNGELLWANIRGTISDFLFNEWKSGALLGAKPEEAFFVRCDRTTMTQNNLDNGQLICLIGVAVVKPAEFVIFRIGQKTADAKN